MPNNSVNTGLGGSLEFRTSQGPDPIPALMFNWTAITPGDSTITDIDLSQLATPTNRQYLPGDLIEDNAITVEFQFDSAGIVQLVPKQQYELTIVWPLASNENTPGKLVGTGYVNSVTTPSFAIDELQMGTMIFKYDGGALGGTAPTFTPATLKT